MAGTIPFKFKAAAIVILMQLKTDILLRHVTFWKNISWNKKLFKKKNSLE